MRRFCLSAMLALAVCATPLVSHAQLPKAGAASVKRSKQTSAKFDIAHLHENEGKLAKAVELYESLYKKNPKDAGVCHRLGVCYARLGDTAQAEKYFAEARTHAPRNSVILNDYGYACYLNERMDLAEECLQTALKVDPNDKRAQTNLALVYGHQQKFEESYRYFRMVGTEAEAHANLGYVYSQHGDGVKATEHYNKALTLDSSLKQAANALLEMNRMEQEMLAKRGQANPASKTAVAANKPAVKMTQLSASKKVQAPAQAPVVARPVVQAEAPTAASNPLVTVKSEAETTVKSSEEALFEVTEAPAVTAAPAAAGPVDLVTLCPRASANAKKLVAELNDAPAAKLKPTLHKLGEMGPAAVGTTSAIRTLLTHKDPYVCIHAALAMFRIDNNATTTLPIMLAGLKHRDAGVRSFAATALGMGPQSQQAIAPLQDALLDSNCYVRLHVAEALAAYPGHESEATSVIVRQLTEKDANVRWLATFLLAELQPQTADAVEGLRVALTDTDPRVRSGAACALGSMGSAAKPALPQLRKAMQDQSADVSQAAADAISDIEATPTQGPLGWNSPASRALRMAKFVRQTHSTSVAQAR